MASDEVRAFVGNAKEKALDYDVILTSPSLGTGVDITFPDREQLIDVVYGIFESGITTHFDFDQQIWRVRHPGTVKVWISPRKFSFDTATDVVKRDIQQKQLYKSVLSDYDENLTPEYHTNDPLIDMAVLARSQQLLSKNNLKRNFIAMKRRHGHTIDLIDKDDVLADDGKTLEAEGRLAVDIKYRERLFDAPILTRDGLEDIEQRIQDNEDVSLAERHSLSRTRIELFYRQPLSNELVDIDDKGRFRQKVSRFEQIGHYTEHARANSFKVEREKSQEYSQRLRFVRDWRNVGGLLFDLFSETGIFSEGRFEAGKTFDLISLQPFMSRAILLKPVIENLLDVEVRKKVDAGVTQLNSLLGLVGLQTELVGKTKAKSVAGGRVIYRYCIVLDSLKLVGAVVKRRTTMDMWKYLDEAYADHERSAVQQPIQVRSN